MSISKLLGHAMPSACACACMAYIICMCAHQHNHLMFVKFVETSKEFDKAKPGAEAEAKHRAKCYRAKLRTTKRLRAEVEATLAGMNAADAEVARAAAADAEVARAAAQGWMPSSFF